MRWLDGITNAMDMNLGKLRDGEGQESLACCSPWSRRESDMTEQRTKKTINFKTSSFLMNLLPDLLTY